MFFQEQLILHGKPAIRLGNGAGASMTIMPEVGGHLARLELKGQEVLDGFRTAQEVDENAWGKSGLLYPFPNRLKNGAFSFQGKKYQFPINDTDTGNALHGFGMQQIMTVDQVDVDEKKAQIKLIYEYDGQLDY